MTTSSPPQAAASGAPEPGQLCRVYRAVADGDGTRAEFADVPVGELGGGEVLIRAHTSSVNYKDALAGTGTGKIVKRLPIVLGIDVAGVVVDSADPRHAVGDRVLVTGFGLSEDHDGGYAEYVRVPADWAVPVPEALDFVDVMALGTAGLTSALAIARLEHNGLRPGQGPVAVTGASGGTGTLAVSMLATLGYEVTAFTGKESAHDLLRRLGATEVLDRPDISARRPLESARWAGAVDCVGGPVLAWLTRTTSRGGSIATFGNTAGVELDTTVLPFILRGINLLGVNTGYFEPELRLRLWERLGSDVRPAGLAELTRVVPFKALPDEFGAFLDSQVTGRIVVDLCAAE
ncbi:MAG: acryloyl-CoA reductase [Dermatophilus congolensis]|nr:acryloyl-CoA reductase [Dermatophilus congolensis]